ncbi:MAG TPA: PorP/SprF family type IX secretion system membrane protein [Bacteroidia bacterium]|jgi:type IX secretion system PorP/SprF family membrane protein
MKHLYSALFIFTATAASYAQDIHLSQFYHSDHLLSPAKVGDFEGDYRVTGNYRNQWREISDPISTYIISFDKAFHYYSHEIDGGIMVARDEFTGFNQVTTKVILTGGYGYKYKGHTFRVGIQPGLTFRKTDLSKQTFPVQWDYADGTFNQDLSNQESNISASQYFFDLNLGVQWNKRFGKLEPKVGFALNHVNRPKDTYFNTVTERLRTRKVVHAEVDYHLSPKFILQPKLLWMWTTNANDMVLGTNVRYKLPNKTITSIFAGIYYRHGIKRTLDAAIPVVGCRFKQIDLGFSYDVNVSSLSDNVKRRTTFEFSLIYTAPSLKPKFTALPCDRY